ncbi:MAG: beta-ketoacyl-[acyl-carrier-protein] synthase family protein [Planctomycetota bacterium]
MEHRVVITGMGIVCPLGHDVPTMWDGLMTGKSGAAATTIFDASTFPTQFDAEVKDYDVSKFLKNPTLHEHGNRGSLLADNIDRSRLGVYLGAGEGSADNHAFFSSIINGWNAEERSMDWGKWTQKALETMDTMRELEQEPNMPAGHLALLTGARGISRSCLTACAASTQAIGEAAMILRQGKADVIVAGGAHSMIHPLGVTGFNRLTALSNRNDSPTTASRPFSATRDGFVLGEGGAVVILETLESAKKRGATVLAELIGFGSSNDAFRVTDMHEEARGAVAAMQSALADANVTTEDIDYISTHGTSTAENDSIETLAIKTVFADHAKNVPVSSPKSQFGHLIGATGCAELITCIKAIEKNTLPMTMNLNDPDPALDLDYIPNEPRKTEVNTVMSESFGFGGQNNVLIIRRFEE